jgi:hypothetical protein
MTTENVKLQLKIRVCFEKNHMSTPPPFSITDYKNQVPHKHCRSTEGQTRVEQFLDLILLSFFDFCFPQSGFWLFFFSGVCLKPGAKLCGCHTVFHLSIHASQIPLFVINLLKKIM